MSKTIQFLIIVSSLFLAACSDNQRVGIDPRPEVRAASDMKENFIALKMNSTDGSGQQGDLFENKGFIKADQFKIGILKSALGKEFLLSTNILSQTPTPMFSGLQSRIVSFIERDGFVYMMDVTQNHKVGVGNTAQNLLLAEFDIVFDDGVALTIDFNQGMRKIFTIGDWYASDDSGTSANYKLPFHQVVSSYMDEVRLTSENLFIRQVTQVRLNNPKGVEAQSYEVRYQLKPYLPDQTFTPKKTPGFEKVGYFEANPLLLNDGTSRVYVSKWHDKKPIRFAISANTPEKYRQVVRDGLLYWNKVLGPNAIEVVQLTDKSLTAPQFDLNIFQWAEWDGAGYAFADAHVDPRSGQITSAQIFFPSAFTDANVAKRLRLLHGQPEQAFRPGLALDGFKKSHLCQRDVIKDLARALELKNPFGISDEAMEKAMLDYVYEVVAHEMGHILGLRHNFAGNLAANYDFNERPELIKSYYKNMKSPDVVTSNSVMEYSRFEESAMNGDQMQNGAPALAYDKVAIDYLYNNIEVPEQSPLFCTDSDINKYADCNMGDAGRSILSSSTGSYDFNLKTLAARVLNIFIAQTKYPDDVLQDLVPVNKVNLNAENLSKLVVSELGKTLSLIKSDARFIAVRGSKPVVLLTDEESLRKEEIAYVENEFERLGGVKEALLKFDPVLFEAEFLAQFNELLQNPDYSTGYTRRGYRWAFSESEKMIMKNIVEKLVSPLKDSLVKEEIKALSGEKFDFSSTYGQNSAEENAEWIESRVSDQLAQSQLNRFTHYMISKTSARIYTEAVMKDGSTKGLDLPVYAYPHDVRVLVTSLFSHSGLDKTWAYNEKLMAEKIVKSEGEVLGDIDSIDLGRLDRSALRWLLQQQELEKAVSQ